MISRIPHRTIEHATIYKIIDKFTRLCRCEGSHDGRDLENILISGLFFRCSSISTIAEIGWRAEPRPVAVEARCIVTNTRAYNACKILLSSVTLHGYRICLGMNSMNHLSQTRWVNYQWTFSSIVAEFLRSQKKRDWIKKAVLRPWRSMGLRPITFSLETAAGRSCQIHTDMFFNGPRSVLQGFSGKIWRESSDEFLIGFFSQNCSQYSSHWTSWDVDYHFGGSTTAAQIIVAQFVGTESDNLSVGPTMETNGPLLFSDLVNHLSRMLFLLWNIRHQSRIQHSILVERLPCKLCRKLTRDLLLGVFICFVEFWMKVRELLG